MSKRGRPEVAGGWLSRSRVCREQQDEDPRYVLGRTFEGGLHDWIVIRHSGVVLVMLEPRVASRLFPNLDCVSGVPGWQKVLRQHFAAGYWGIAYLVRSAPDVNDAVAKVVTFAAPGTRLRVRPSKLETAPPLAGEMAMRSLRAVRAQAGGATAPSDEAVRHWLSRSLGCASGAGSSA